MKIAFDIDGTLTDYNKFVKKHALDYFISKYNMIVRNSEALEIEEILDMKLHFMNQGMTKSNAENEIKKVLNKFWLSLHCLPFFTCRFRNGAAKYIKKLRKSGHVVEIHTSRAKTCSNGVIGKTARAFTIFQFALNGIRLRKKEIRFYKNDDDKIKGLIESRPDLVFDDKPDILNEMKRNNINVICLKGTHNQNIEAKFPCIYDFDEQMLMEVTNEVIGTLKLKYFQREAKSSMLFNKLKILRPIIFAIFKPVILNADNILKSTDTGIIYAPNHQSTLDPIIVTGIICTHIHWVALLRFFNGEDSIFNNSKNPLLCKITATAFERLDYFPIDRKSDNANANNFISINEMNQFLKIKSKIGIFPEGTTRKQADCDFGIFDESFILMAKRNCSVIQPITINWIQDKKVKSKIVVNFGKIFDPKNMSVKEAMERFMQVQNENLKENKNVINKLSIK